MGYRISTMSSVAGVLVWTVLSLGLEADPQRASPVGAGSDATFSKATYTYKRVGECDIKADVYRLPGKEVRPAIVWIHGGALIFGDRSTVRPDQLQRYLQAGYALVSIDYRLAPETKLPEILEDLRDAYKWVREKGPELFWIDRDRIALVGNSAGGYLALMSGQEAQAVLSDSPRHQGVSADAPSPRRQGHRCSIRGVRANGRSLEAGGRAASTRSNAQLRSPVRRLSHGLEAGRRTVRPEDPKVAAAYDDVVEFLRKHVGR